MGNQHPSQSIRWAVFALVLAGFAAFILTQPYQSQTTLFIVLIPVSLVLGALFVYPQQFKLSAFSAASDTGPADSVSTDVVAVGSYPGETITTVPSQALAVQTGVVNDEVTYAEEEPAERWKKALILTASLVMMFIGQLQIFRDSPDFPTGTSFVLILLGLAIFFVTTNGAALDNPQLAVPQVISPLRVKWRWMAASVGLAAFAAWRNSIEPAQGYLSEYILVLGLSVICFITASKPPKKALQPVDTNPLHRSEILLLIGLFIAAFVIRGYHINTLPRMFDNDEGNISLSGLDIRTANFLTNPFSAGYLDLPIMSSLLIGISTRFFGQTPEAARFPSVLFGALTVPAIYLLGRELFGRRIALIAALFSLAWALEVQMSRLALNQAGDIFFGALTFYFLLKGLRRGRALDYVWCGIALAYSQLFFVMGRQVPIVLVAYLIYLAIRQRQLLIRQGRLLLIIPAMAFLMLLPQIYHMLYYHEELFEHTVTNIVWGGQLGEQIAAGNLGPYLKGQLSASFLSLLSTHDEAVYYGPGSNYMGPIGGPPLLLGVVMSLLVLRKKPQWSLPLGWGLSTLLFGGFLTTSPPQYQRLAAGAPAFALLAALGVETIGRAFADVLQNRQLLARVALGVGTVMCVANLVFYVGVFVPENRDLATRQNWGSNRAAADIVSNTKSGREVVLIGGGDVGVSHQSPVLDFLTKGLPFIDNEDVSQLDAQLADFDPHKPFFIMATPDHKPQLDTLVARYPGGTLDEVHLDEDDSLAYYTYTSS